MRTASHFDYVGTTLESFRAELRLNKNGCIKGDSQLGGELATVAQRIANIAHRFLHPKPSAGAQEIAGLKSIGEAVCGLNEYLRSTGRNFNERAK